MQALRSRYIDSGGQKEDDNGLEGRYGADGFFFQQRRGRLNFRTLGSLNVDKLVSDVDIDVLQQHMENITFCDLREEDLRYLTDPQIVKLFRVSQLTIEYLLYSQDQLVDKLNNLSKKYTAKKRSLMKKRKELAELNESSHHLRNQVRAKKQNISTLEDLLRETNKARDRELLAMRKASKIPSGTAPRESALPFSILNFFVVGADGVCIEFNERRDTLISELTKKVVSAIAPLCIDDSNARDRFPADRLADEKDRPAQDLKPTISDCKLLYLGRLLLPSATIDSYNVRDGDTLFAQVTHLTPNPRPSVEPVKAEEQPVQEAKPNEDNRTLSEVLKFMDNQQASIKDFAVDMRKGWESALTTITAAKADRSSGAELQALEKLDNRLERMGAAVSEDLEKRVAELQDALLLQAQNADRARNEEGNVDAVVRRRTVAGDIESDDDHSLDEVHAKLRASQNKIGFLEGKSSSAEDEIRRLKEEMEQLRRLMASRPPPVTAAPSPAPTSAPAPVLTPVGVKRELKAAVPTMQEQVLTAKVNRWNYVAGTGLPKDTGTAVVAPREFSPAVEKPVPAAAAAAAVRPVVPESAPVTVAVFEPPPPVEAMPETVTIVFPVEHNPSTAAISSTIEASEGSPARTGLVVQLERNLMPDDLIFELRKAVAAKAKVTIGKVSVKLHGKDIRLALDLPEDALSELQGGFTAESCAVLALEGSLTVALALSNPVTNAQVDLLVASWERTVLRDSQNSDADHDSVRGAAADEQEEEEPLSMSAGFPPRSQSVRRSRSAKKRRDWDADDAEEKDVAGGLSAVKYRAVRGSLEDALTSLSDKEGLSGDELQRKMQSLNRLSRTLPAPMVNHLRSFKSSMVGAMAAATVDSGSGSEGMSTDDQRVSRAMSKARSSFGASTSSLRSSIESPLLRLSSARTNLVGSPVGPDAEGRLRTSTRSLRLGAAHRRDFDSAEEEADGPYNSPLAARGARPGIARISNSSVKSPPAAMRYAGSVADSLESSIDRSLDGNMRADAKQTTSWDRDGPSLGTESYKLDKFDNTEGEARELEGRRLRDEREAKHFDSPARGFSALSADSYEDERSGREVGGRGDGDLFENTDRTFLSSDADTSAGFPSADSTLRSEVLRRADAYERGAIAGDGRDNDDSSVLDSTVERGAPRRLQQRGDRSGGGVGDLDLDGRFSAQDSFMSSKASSNVSPFGALREDGLEQQAREGQHRQQGQPAGGRSKQMSGAPAEDADGSVHSLTLSDSHVDDDM